MNIKELNSLIDKTKEYFQQYHINISDFFIEAIDNTLVIYIVTDVEVNEFFPILKQFDNDVEIPNGILIDVLF